MDFQKVADAIEKSRPEITDLLFSEDTGNFLNNLAQQNNLDEEKTLNMIDEVGYVVLGLKERASLKSSLSALGIPNSSVLSIIQEVNRKIFTELDKADNKEIPDSTASLDQPEPVIITQETKDEAKQRLSERMGTSEPKPVETPAEVPEVKSQVPPAVAHPRYAEGSGEARGSGMAMEVAPQNLPAVEPGEVAHEVPHVEIPIRTQNSPITPPSPEPKLQVPPSQPSPTSHYPSGKDPYREPL